MALTLFHSKFKAILDSLSGTQSYAVYIPESAGYPAIAYALTGLSRDIESNLANTTVSAHVYNVFIVDTTFTAVQTLTQNIINTLDQYRDADVLLTLIEDVQDDYDGDRDLFIKNLTVSVRVKE